MRRPLITPIEGFLLAAFALGLVVSLAIQAMAEPVYPENVAYALVVTSRPRPTPTATVDWWSRTKLAEVELPKLPNLPGISLSGATKSNGYVGGQPVPFETLSCPTGTVRIDKVVTANRAGMTKPQDLRQQGSGQATVADILDRDQDGVDDLTQLAEGEEPPEPPKMEVVPVELLAALNAVDASFTLVLMPENAEEYTTPGLELGKMVIKPEEEEEGGQ